MASPKTRKAAKPMPMAKAPPPARAMPMAPPPKMAVAKGKSNGAARKFAAY